MKNAIALGTFDGVHIGHRAVLDLPDEYNKIAVVFKEPPRTADSGDKELLTLYSDKCRILKKIGINEVFPLDFDNIRNMKAESFLEYINEKFSPALISCGFNYRFGKDALGTTETLNSFCSAKNIIFKCSPPVEFDGTVVSSTAIRNLLSNGDIEKANEMLSESFSFSAEVISGDKRGRTIGFPTINQKYPDGLVTLRFGVYKSRVILDGKEYNGITNIGIRPTYRSDFIICETYIDGFDDDIYGRTVKIMPLRFLREEIKFSSLDELKNQILKDIRS